MHKTNDQQKCISVIKAYFVVSSMHSGMFEAMETEVPQLGQVISSVGCWRFALLDLTEIGY